MILQKVNFFRFFIQFWVQAVHLEEKVRKSAYTHFENKWGVSEVKKIAKCAIS